MYAQDTVVAYLDALASSEPTPGGGSTAALTGALAAGLVSMVCRLTIGKRRFRDVQAAMQETLGQAEVLRQRLTDLMERDAAAYAGVMRAHRLPQQTAEEQADRRLALGQALEEATLSPLEVAEGCASVLELALPAAQLGNPWAVSDAGAAALLAEAALHAALLNVHINLHTLANEGLADTALATEARRRVEDLIIRAQQKEPILAHVRQRIAG